MQDFLHKMLKFVDYERYKVLAIVVLMAFMVWGSSCESETVSLLDPAVEVSRTAFQIEAVTAAGSLESDKAAAMLAVEEVNARILTLNKLVEQGLADLQKQDEIKAQLFEITGSVVTQWATGGVPVEALVGTALTGGGLLLGIGAIGDKRRADALLAKPKPPT